MATAYPLPTLGPTVDANGISIPSFNDVYQSLLAIFQSIYGAGIYVAADSQDGQWIAALAKAIDDSNKAAVQVFQSFSPTYAQGVGLSSLVKINGLKRNVPTYSTAPGNVVGEANSVILAGVVKDDNGNLWNLPTVVTIPSAGTIAVTVTAQQPGAINAPAGSINALYNPQRGWQSFTSTADATAGGAVELDPALRARQSISTSITAQTPSDAILAAVSNVTGVVRAVLYDNDSDVTDASGIPAHNICVVVEGGAIPDIAAAIGNKKTPGIPTYGTTSAIVYDALGLPRTINFYILQLVPIYYAITIKTLPGYSAATGGLIQSALAAFTNSLAIGGDVYTTQAQAAASLMSVGLGQTFYITAFTLGTAASPVGVSNIAILFNQAASSDSANVALTVT